MNYYQFHIGDYTTATVHLTPLEDLTYRRLIDFYFMKESPIPLDTDWVTRRLRLDTEDVKNVLNEFFTETEGGWKNDRCDDDIAKYHAMANRNKVNGSRGGRPKKNPNKPSGLRVATESEPTGKPTSNQEPVTSNQEPKEEKVKKESTYKTLSEDDFKIEVYKFSDKYSTDMLDSFYEYWSEPDSKGKMKFQLLKTWEISRRLGTWNRNDFNKSNSQSGGECAGQSIEIPREQWINYYGSEQAAIDSGKIKAEVR